MHTEVRGPGVAVGQYHHRDVRGTSFPWRRSGALSRVLGVSPWVVTVTEVGRGRSWAGAKAPGKC